MGLTQFLRQARTGLDDIRGAASRRALVILAYHGIREDSAPVRNWMLLPQSEFDKQVRILRDRYDILRLDDAVARLRDGALERTSVCITFDDGYLNNLSLAHPILQAHDAPATIFLATDFIDSHEVPWTTALDAAFEATRTGRIDLSRFGLGTWTHASADEARRNGVAIKTRLKELEAGHRAEVLHALFAQLPGPSPSYLDAFRFLSWEQVRELERTGVVSFGAHTVHHEILSRLPDESVSSEIRNSVAKVAAECALPSRGFAYPNGRAIDFDARAEAAVASSGCDFAVTTISGFNTMTTPRFGLRRLSIGGDCDLAAFRRLLSKPRNAVVALARFARAR